MFRKKINTFFNDLAFKSPPTAPLRALREPGGRPRSHHSSSARGCMRTGRVFLQSLFFQRRGPRSPVLPRGAPAPELTLPP